MTSSCHCKVTMTPIDLKDAIEEKIRLSKAILINLASAMDSAQNKSLLENCIFSNALSDSLWLVENYLHELDENWKKFTNLEDF